MYPQKVVALYVALMAVVIAFVGGRHPFPRFGPANHVTMIRAVIVVLVAGLVGEPAFPRSIATVSVATGLMAALDGVDGWLARRSGMASDFGARFDMETDALFIMVLSILAWQYGNAGAWVLLCGLMRYAFVAAGWLLPWMARPLRPTPRGKTVCVLQMIGLGVATLPGIHPPVSTAVAAVTLAALAWSFAIDVRWLWRNRAASRPMPGCR